MHMSNDTFPSSPDNVCASFDYNPIKEGSRFDVYKASMFYARNYESMEKAVVKASRSSHADEAFWDKYLKILETASHSSSQFKEELHKHKHHPHGIIFPKCYVSAMDSTSSKLNSFFGHMKGYRKHIKKDEYVLIEPHIEGHWERYVNCDGTILENCPEILQAFCHFTYYHSDGQLMITGLKGSFHEGHYNLTVPNIHSSSHMYGQNDVGMDGIMKFFSRHNCNEICKSWPKPGFSEHSNIQSKKHSHIE